jgi:hypothetical protein
MSDTTERTRFRFSLKTLLLIITILALCIGASVFVVLGVYAEAADRNLAQAQDKADVADSVIAKLAKLDSAGEFIRFDDLDEFRPGQAKNEILKDLRWRAGYVTAAKCDGKSITAIDYDVYADGPGKGRSEGVHALFVNDKFEKFIRWQIPDFDGTAWSPPRSRRIGDDCGWLTRAIRSKAVGVDELRKAVKSKKAPPEHIDPGLTAVYLGFRALGLAPGPPPPEKDPEKLRKNIALRDQFNAARLSIGMTESEVEATLKAKPLESGKVEAGNYSIYGTNESFVVNDWLWFSPFSNILVVFRDGKAIAITSIRAMYEWHRDLEQTLIDLPKRDPITK